MSRYLPSLLAESFGEVGPAALARLAKIVVAKDFGSTFLGHLSSGLRVVLLQLRCGNGARAEGKGIRRGLLGQLGGLVVFHCSFSVCVVWLDC